MVARKPGRFLAPVALIAVLVAVLLIVNARTGSHKVSAPARLTPQRTVTHPAAAPKQSFYVIKAGDTLSSISAKTGVPIATLQALNPSLSDPNALQTGQKIRLQH